MLETHIDLPGYSLRVFEEAADGVSGDDYIVLELPDLLRFGVFDGVTPTDATPAPLGERGDSFASSTLRAAFRSSKHLLEIAEDANRYLYDFAAPRGRDRTQSTALLLDIRAEESFLLRAGDCEAWALYDRWERVFELPAIKDPKEHEAWQAENWYAPRPEHHRASEELLGQPHHWRSAALGRFPEPVVDTAILQDGWREIILASDGAMLQPEIVADFEAWPRWIGEQTFPGPHKKKDDVVLLHLQRALR